ncbi:helix-turn-helix domain-containing protein [Streptomyces radicis]|uniref:Helix-turn-helix domain-containing protein n=1 Tax=Streptomyces radicis TaxID=1750517 RepID=A0A3A9W6V2_9ACTN|nr:helix-turn-helix transcriptional regulator [Streptomyces radicis]RKN08931.1 helix-turn-helix domain-containing protein [Streptomyces radicis]RKN22877.1 helix-turn-helix domain-containing protein [Streptomyces radicis]
MHDRTATPPKGRGIGARIQEIRQIRGFSLSELGRRAHVSPSQLSRVENGKRYASPSTVASVARALGVGADVLRGQPYIHMLQRDQLDALLSPISSALHSWDLPPEDEPPPRSLDVLESAMRRMVDLRVRTEFAEIAADLPGLIVESALAAEIHDRPGHDRERAHAVQAEVARTAAIIAYRLGFMDLSRLALSRMAVAAPQSGDPRQLAVERYERAQITHAVSGRPDRGVALMKRALRDLDDDGTLATRAVRGTLQLRASVLSAEQNEQDDWLGQAEELADGTGETTDYAMAFGPLNVALNKMATAAARDEHEEALNIAAGVRLPEDYTPTRAAGFWVGKAKSETWAARHGDALDSLYAAREVAPQLTRYHPGVHETVGTLLRARPRPSARLRAFAQWSGV